MPAALGFDLGGTQVRAALVQDGAVVRREALWTDVSGGPDAVMCQFMDLASKVMGDVVPAAVGIAAPGPLDTVSGVVDHIPTLPGWDGFPLRDRVREAFGLPVVVENDGIAAAQGEWQHGAGRGLRHLVYVTVSTGVGGGVVMDGRLLHGRRGMGAHVGHFRMAQDGPTCSCGRSGCFEAFVAGTALGRRTRAQAKAEKSGHLGQIKGREVESRDAVEGARQGDMGCLDLLAEEARLLGQGFASLSHLYGPERIIVGGGVSHAFDLMRDGILREYRAEAMPPYRDVEIMPAALGDNAGLIGAADLALNTRGGNS